MKTYPVGDDPESQLGKYCRAWLREHQPGEKPEDTGLGSEAQAQGIEWSGDLTQLLYVACTDKPYINRQGTWPLIIQKWLGHLHDQSQYPSMYRLIDTALRYSNAKTDQLHWSSQVLSLSLSERRVLFKRTQELLVEAARTHKNKQVSMLAKNMQGLYADMAWVEKSWFKHWNTPQTLQITAASNHMQEVGLEVLVHWCAEKKTRDERIHAWLQHVRELGATTASLKEAILAGVTHYPWAQDLHPHMAPMLNTLFTTLDDQELWTVSKACNLRHPASLHQNSSPLLTSLVLKAWCARPNTTLSWTDLLHNGQTWTPMGLQMHALLMHHEWPVVFRDADDKSRTAFLLAASMMQEKGMPNVDSDLTSIGKDPLVARSLIQLGLENWTELWAVYSKPHAAPPTLSVDTYPFDAAPN